VYAVLILFQDFASYPDARKRTSAPIMIDFTHHRRIDKKNLTKHH